MRFLQIAAFDVEEWMNAYETKAEYNIAETCVQPLKVGELLELAGVGDGFTERLLETRLHYGWIEGSPDFRAGVADLYETLEPQHVLATTGAAGANFLVYYSLVEPGDHVVCVHPTYQQLYSIPASFRADVSLLPLHRENSYLPDPEELHSLLQSQTRVISLNNPHNPSGALIPAPLMQELVEVARSADAYLLCDEVYRGLYHQGVDPVPSAADLYEKAISTGSMSKVFSLAGLRMGWIASQDKEVIRRCLQHRDYTTISCGVLSDQLAALALGCREEILKRNTRIVRRNLTLLDAWVADQPHTSYVKPRAGTTAFLEYNLSLPSRELCLELLRKTGTLLVPGGCFGVEGFVRIGYACSTQELKAALDRFAEYLSRY